MAQTTQKNLRGNIGFIKSKKKSFSRDDCHVVQLLNAFIYKGPYGSHFCMVFEILGVNLLELIKKYEYNGCPAHLCRKIAKQCLIGLDYLHNICKIIHTDLKPENVLMTLTPDQINEIVELGQLKRNPELESKIKILHEVYKLKSIPEIIAECKPDWEIAAKAAGNPLEIVKDSAKKQNNKAPAVKTLEDCIQMPDNEEDFDAKQEYDRIINDKSNQINQRDKKNLLKKLKRKEKKIKKKYGIGSRKNSGDDGSENEDEVKPLPKIAVPIKEESEDEEGLISEDDENEPDPEVANFRLKIADLGNACWVHHHFQPEIQTRQYRSPEVILGIKYNETADIWSFACMVFEMMQGDFLFAPQKQENFSKSDDHLALVDPQSNPRSWSICKSYQESTPPLEPTRRDSSINGVI